MRRVLIVSPRFPPVNAPDHHRVRASLPYYSRFGWEATVLAIAPETISDSVKDPDLEDSLPSESRIVRVAAWDEAKCRRAGFGQLDYRSLWPLYTAGAKLLREEEHEVVFFSTTVFLSFLLGPIWKRQFGCKVVYDFQDPWFQGSTPLYTRESWPGNWWKLRAGQLLAKHGESLSLRVADHVISVSDGYVSTLRGRYPRLAADQFTVLPFGASREDFEFVEKRGIRHDVFTPDRQRLRWVYAGRIGPDMFAILGVFFAQLANLKRDRPDLARRLDVFFVGTNYSPADRTFKVVEPLAREWGVEDIVSEHSERIPYFHALSLYSECDGILLIGSNSGDYTASKLFNCVLAKKPVLALFHADSLVSRVAYRFPNVRLSSFESDPAEPKFGAEIAGGLKWLLDAAFDRSTIDELIAPWSALESTRIQCAVFDEVARR